LDVGERSTGRGIKMEGNETKGGDEEEWMVRGGGELRNKSKAAAAKTQRAKATGPPEVGRHGRSWPSRVARGGRVQWRGSSVRIVLLPKANRRVRRDGADVSDD
jgi:hypothetical protein